MAKPHTQPCPVAQMLNIIGDRWTLLIIREAFYGATRFSEFERRTGIAKNILSERLQTLTQDGLLERSPPDSARPTYRLTAKGQSLLPVLVAMFQWGAAHLFEDGAAPVRIVEKSSGRDIARMGLTSDTGQTLGPDDIAVLFAAPPRKEPQP